ncbi:MAG: hypothetical protein QM702_20805 [Rubrivivax sp.]
MRARTLVLSLAMALGASSVSCSRTAGVAIVEIRAGRLPDNNISADVEVEVYEQGGGAVGTYCISVHFMPSGFVAETTDPSPSYGGEYDIGATKEFCPARGEDLHDGDRRVFRFVTNKTDIPAGGNLRAQTRIGNTYDYADVSIP